MVVKLSEAPLRLHLLGKNTNVPRSQEHRSC